MRASTAHAGASAPWRPSPAWASPSAPTTGRCSSPAASSSASRSRARSSTPSLLLADEPTGALDSRTANEILGLFQELNREGVTIVLVTHDAEVGQHARRLVRFKDGNVIEDRRQEPVDARENRWRARMRLTEAIRSALSAIRANALRSLLTMLGIVIGVRR